mgnify:CR=1 FL=1
MLEMIGCIVLQARTGAEALDIANAYNGEIDLALLDLELPTQGEIDYIHLL